MTSRPNCRHPEGCIAKGTGHCRSCNMTAIALSNQADPAVRAKMSEARKKAWADPAVRPARRAAFTRRTADA